MRCLALAHAWRSGGGEAFFACAEIIQPLRSRLAEEGFRVIELGVVPGCEDDSRQATAWALEVGARWIVTDGYRFEAAYQSAIKDAGFRALCVEDYAHANHYCADLVLNQNVCANDELYASREPSTSLLLGTRYALLRREFWPWADRQRFIPDVARNILVTLGGGDPDNVTLKAVEALASFDREDSEVTVVVGGGSPHTESIQCAAGPCGMRVLSNPPDLPALMSGADVAVCAAGSTVWEAAFTGMPAITIVLADNQRPIAECLASLGVVRNLGWHTSVSPGDITDCLRELSRDRLARERMSSLGRNLVDGKGGFRVCAAMKQVSMTLRRAREEDCRLLWQWVNEPAVRESAFSTDPIPWESHCAWFRERLADPDCYLYVAEDEDGAPVGQARLESDGVDAEIDISVAQDYRRLGYGRAIIARAAESFFAELAADTIHAWVKLGNTGSLKAFESAGFACLGDEQVRGSRAMHYVRRRY